MRASVPPYATLILGWAMLYVLGHLPSSVRINAQHLRTSPGHHAIYYRTWVNYAAIRYIHERRGI
jgi:hypothetical protein